jgi:hypothetical protein
MSHTHFYLSAVLVRKTTERRLGNFEQSSVLSDIGEHWTESTSTLFFEGLTKLLGHVYGKWWLRKNAVKAHLKYNP